MQVRVDYSTKDGQRAGVAGASLLLDATNLRGVSESSGVSSKVMLFSFDGSWFNNGGAALVADADDGQETLTVLANERPGRSHVLLENTEQQELGRSLSFELQAVNTGIDIVDAEGELVVQWLETQQSWWCQGQDLGRKLRFVLEGVVADLDAAYDRALLAPTVRERLSPLAERHS
jgi:hypothetical protein